MKYMSFAQHLFYQNGKFSKSGSTATQLSAQSQRYERAFFYPSCYQKAQVMQQDTLHTALTFKVYS